MSTMAQALVLGVVTYVALTVTGVAENLSAVLLQIGAPHSAVLSGAVEAQQMQTITFTKTLPDGTVVTATYVQRPDETYAAFIERANAEWAALCKSLGL